MSVANTQTKIAWKRYLTFAGKLTAGAWLTSCASSEPPVAKTKQKFQIEEASIKSLHAAIQSGATTCVDVVQAYIDRAKAYNGVCTALITADGAPIAPAAGYVRSGAPLKFPTETVAASSIFPNLDLIMNLFIFEPVTVAIL